MNLWWLTLVAPAVLIGLIMLAAGNIKIKPILVPVDSSFHLSSLTGQVVIRIFAGIFLLFAAVGAMDITPVYAHWYFLPGTIVIIKGFADLLMQIMQTLLEIRRVLLPEKEDDDQAPKTS